MIMYFNIRRLSTCYFKGDHYQDCKIIVQLMIIPLTYSNKCNRKTYKVKMKNKFG